MGLAARMILRQHLAAVGFVLFALLVVAFSIDLAQSHGQIQTRAETTGQPPLRIIGAYLGQRATDMATRLLPLACLAGSFIAELRRPARLETVILSGAGAPSWLSLRALGPLGLGLGALLWLGETHLRPAAVAAQVQSGLGRYAERFDPSEAPPRWIARGGTLWQIEARRGADAALERVTVFEGLDSPTGAAPLSLTLQEAGPGLRPAAGQPLASAGSEAPNATTYQGPVQSWRLDRGGLTEQGTQNATLRLPYTPLQARYEGIPGLYIPQADLRRLAGLAHQTPMAGAERAADLRTALTRRMAALFLPMACLALGASLGQLAWRDRRLPLFRTLALAALGYGFVVSVKVFHALGELAALPAVAACALPLVAMLLAAAAAQVSQAGRL